MRFLSALLIALLCFATPALSTADTPKEIEQARGHFTKGAEFYASGEYSKAIVEFINGHNIAPNAMFLYNISLCYQRLENFDDARDAARKARNFEGMTEPVKIRNEARIASLETAISARDLVEEMAAAAAEPSVTETPPPADTSTFGALGWTGVVMTALGTSALIVSFVLNQQVADDKEAIDAAQARNDFEEARRLTEEVNSTRTTGLIALFSGIGLAAVGVSFIAWDLLNDDSEATVTAAPTADGAGIAVGLSGRF